MKQYKVAILGATGAVGREMMKILAERDFPVAELHLLASERCQAGANKSTRSVMMPSVPSAFSRCAIAASLTV